MAADQDHGHGVPPEVQLQSLSAAGRALGMDVAEYVLPESRHAVLHGHRLHYLDWGTPGQPLVVLLHGVGLTAHTWDLVALALRHDHHCVALDLRGHGDSEWSPVLDYGVAAHGRDVASLVEHLDAGPVVLVGMSMGGMCAVQAAAGLGDRVRGLVLVDIGPPLVEEATGEPPPRPGGPFLPGELDTFEDFVDQALAFNPKRDRAQLRVSLRHNLRQLPDGRWTWKYDRRFYGNPEIRRPAPTSVWGHLDDLRCPGFVIRGGESRVLSPAAAAALADRLPGGRWVEVAGAGHTVQGDQPAAFVEAIRPFLAEITAREG